MLGARCALIASADGKLRSRSRPGQGLLMVSYGLRKNLFELGMVEFWLKFKRDYTSR